LPTAQQGNHQRRLVFIVGGVDVDARVDQKCGQVSGGEIVMPAFSNDVHRSIQRYWVAVVHGILVSRQNRIDGGLLLSHNRVNDWNTRRRVVSEPRQQGGKQVPTCQLINASLSSH